MWVDSHDEYAQVADFDPATGRLTVVSRATSGAPEDYTCGHFAMLYSAPAVLYRIDNALWLRLGSHERDVDQQHTHVTLSRHASQRVLRLLEQGAVVAEATYEVPPASADLGPTPFARSEDWDFGELVVNVLKDRSRRERIYREVP